MRSGMLHQPMSRVAPFAVLVSMMCITHAGEGDEKVRAFPTAEGYGRFAEGGRGGDLYMVTTLANDSIVKEIKPGVYEGSFRGACEATRPRTVVFKVGGIIELEKYPDFRDMLTITSGHITIAGETAPGDGIALKRKTGDGKLLGLEKVDHVIIRNLRFRYFRDIPLDNYNNNPGRCLAVRASNCMIDHCSFSWSPDDLVHVSSANSGRHNVTIQWCIYAEPLWSERRGGIGGYGATRITYYKNLWEHIDYRTPAVGGAYKTYWGPPGTYSFSVINNVVYNYSIMGILLGNWREDDYKGDQIKNRINCIGNFLKTGPDGNAPRTMGFRDITTTYANEEKIYVQGNLSYHRPNDSMDQWANVGQTTPTTKKIAPRIKRETIFSPIPHDTADIPNYPDTHSAGRAYDDVLGLTPGVLGAGAVKPRLDAADTRYRTDANAGGKVFEADAGRQPTTVASLPDDASGKRYFEHFTNNVSWGDEGWKDTDHDGMEDGWEVRTYGRTETQDHKTFDPKYQNGKYTCLERFLHYKAGDTSTDNGETNKQ